MDHRIRTWTPRLLFLVVIALLTLIGVIQYQWFSRSAAVEIDNTVKGLESGLRQAVSREFQRFAVVFTELDALRNGSVRAQDVRPLLDRLWETYGAGGTVSSLLESVAYGHPGQTMVKKSAGQDWTTTGWPTDQIAGGPLPQGNGTVLIQNTIFYFTSRRPNLPDVVLGLDLDAFFRAYVVPALAEVSPGAVLSWSPSFRGPPPGEAFDASKYTFNPFTSLFSGSSLPRTLDIGIPRLTDQQGRFFRSLATVPLPSKEDVLGTVVPSAPALSSEFALADAGPAPGLDPQGPTMIRALSSWNVSVTLPADAPILAVEQRLAWNWLGGSLLLVVLAAAFGLVLRQSSRLGELRRREREFVASVSHELRTPLTVIRSAADNFTKGIVAPDRLGKYGHLILDQSIRLGRMIEEMLAFAQTEVTTAAPVQARVEFDLWLSELRPPLEALAAERQIHLTWDVKGLPPAGLTDPDSLRLVLDNLVVNALNHAYPPPGEPGQRSVRVTLRHLVPDRLELTVEDEGRGISPREAKKVFEPFYRDQVSRNNQEKGSGLGLFLALHRAKRLNGTLTLESPWRRLDGSRRPGCRFALTIGFWPEGVSHGR